MSAWLRLVLASGVAVSSLMPAVAQQHVHVVRMGRPKIAANSCSTTPNAVYWGGPVISNVKVYAVFWGSNLEAQTTANIGNFFKAVTNSSYLDLLSEYTTVGFASPTTNQVIGRGTFAGQKAITPSVCNTTSSCTLNDTQIQNELISQIQAGHLPGPALDAGGNVNTLYMIYFPANVNIDDPVIGKSCVNQGFCAYHNTTTNQLNAHNLIYGVNPDVGPSSGCFLGCGSNANWYDNLTAVSSHEMGESITDAEVGIAPVFGPPLGWYDKNCGEIGDTCNGQDTTITVGGVNYSVQQLWSNRQHDCVSSGPALVPKFHVTAPANVTPGAQFNVTVTAQNSSGSTLTNYTGTVHFKSTDVLAILPLDYTFTTSNMGMHGFVATLKTVGTQNISVNDTTATAVKGSALVVAGSGAPSVTSLSSSLNPTTFGQAVTFTAKVTSPAVGTPTGTVTFKDGTTTLGTGTLNSAMATLTTSTLSAGAHSITAVYGGDATYAASTSPMLSETVNKASTNTALSSSSNPGGAGQSITFTARVTTSAGAGTPTGNVTFKNGTTIMAMLALNSSGIATMSTSFSALGSYSISAVYGGDADHAGSTSATLVEVIRNATKTSLSSSVNPSTIGQSITFTATVTSAVAGSFTGTVTFKDGTTVLASPAISTAGVATYTTSALAAGLHSITARYNGNTAYAPSTSPALTQNVVGTAVSTTALVSSLNPSTYGQAVTFTAAVKSASAPTPTGTVTFMNGTATLGTVALASGVAKLTTGTITLSGGVHTIKAMYNGNATYNVSGATITQTVQKAATNTSVSSSANPSTLGQAVTFTAKVISTVPGTFTGTVTFKDGTTVLASPTISSSGVATYMTTTLAHGSHSITAHYNANTNYATSTSSVLTQTVN